MRARNRPERQNECDERCAGRERVGQQRDRDVAAGQPFAHDAGADDGGQQERRAERFSVQSRRAAQHCAAAAGFMARMNALMNLPSTCGAIASTSMPCPLRNARASSML